MKLTARCRGPFGCSLGLVVLLAALAPTTAVAMSSESGTLSPRLALLARPSLRAASPLRQASALSVAPSGPGSLQREGSRVLLDVRFQGGAASSLSALAQAGARVVALGRRYQTVTVAASPASFPAVAALPRVRSVEADLAPIVSAAPGTAETSPSICEGGSVISEGVNQLHVGEARDDFGVTGSGVTVGILSDSFDTATKTADGGSAVVTHAAEDIESGDLPGTENPCSGQKTPVDVLRDYAPTSAGAEEPQATDEGRAMAQIVHDVAPDAALDFATAFPTEANFAENIKRLVGAGARVIADDVSYLDEPFFQDGPAADAVDEAAAAGVDYFSAAGNNNLIDSRGREIGSWEAPEFRDAKSCPAALEANPELGAEHCMNFNPEPGGIPDTTFGIEVARGATLSVDLQWAEPWYGVKSDIDTYLLNSEGKLIEGKLIGSNEDNLVTEKPFEYFQWENKTGSDQEVQLVINRCSSTCNPQASAVATPRLKFSLLENGGGVLETEYPTSSEGDTVGPTLFGHSGAAGAISVAAVPYDDSEEPEGYSSRGPVTHYFGPVTGTVPAARLASAQTISKPDIAASDCVATTFFAVQEEGVWRFCGTSAAAPHGAGVAALMLQANPTLTPTQLRAAMAASAVSVGSYGSNSVGAGLLDALGAVARVATPPTVSITQAPKTISRDARPAIAFTANRPVSFSCSIDRAQPQRCESPYVPAAALADGPHSFTVSGADIAGRVGTSSVTFSVETRQPKTFFLKHPHKLILTHKRAVRASFRFGSNQSGVTFLCRVDRSPLRDCGRSFSRAFTSGSHVVSVRASDAAGNVDATPAIFHFRVKRLH